MEEMKFEKALGKLEEIVSSLESNEISLDDALKKYEEGVKLTKVCTKKLNEAERKVEILTKSMDGEVEIEDFDLEKKSSSKGAKTKKSGKPSKDEGTLF